MICIPQDPTGRLIPQTTIGAAASIIATQPVTDLHLTSLERRPQGRGYMAYCLTGCFTGSPAPPGPLEVLGLR